MSGDLLVSKLVDGSSGIDVLFDPRAVRDASPNIQKPDDVGSASGSSLLPSSEQMGTPVMTEPAALKLGDIAKPKKDQNNLCYSDGSHQSLPDSAFVYQQHVLFERGLNWVNVKRKADFSPTLSYIEEEGRAHYGAVHIPGFSPFKSRADDYVPIEGAERKSRGKKTLLWWFLSCCRK